MNRIAVFADVQNIYYTTRDAFGRQFDYRRLWNEISERGDVTLALAYATDRGDAGQRRFQAALEHIGFTVKLKPFIQRADGSAKGDWDVGITIDVLDAVGDVDTVVLLSGDGDFAVLLDRVRQSGVNAEVYGVPRLTADALVQAATTFFPIGESLLLD